MKFIKDFNSGDRVADIYFCKHIQAATTKNGKTYYSVTLQDKTGTVDAKVWEPNSEGIDDFDSLDYIDVYGEVTSFNGALQVNIKRARLCHEGEYDESLYLPVSSKNNDEMYKELLSIINTVGNKYLKDLGSGGYEKLSPQKKGTTLTEQPLLGKLVKTSWKTA